jgi:hypothetical protein
MLNKSIKADLQPMGLDPCDINELYKWREYRYESTTFGSR